MIPRYAPQQIAKIFSDASRLQRWLDVELLACEGWAELGRIPIESLSELQGASVDADRVAELEAEQGHDVAAFVAAVQETVGDAGRYFHLGLTSSDIVDTALATQLRDAAGVIDEDTEALVAALVEQAERHRLTVMMGRTHGVHAEPLTLGIKLANFVDEVRRARTRLAAATAEIAVGQITGAVGTHASVPPEIEEHVCAGLKLTVAPVATQVLARDRHASFVTALALLGAVLERLATTIRLLQITEVDEVEEPFGSRQKGSSAMPHKRNPILCERVVGLARVLRGYALTAMEDVALWHERDISHSSAERVILPDACALSDYIVRLSARIVAGLRVKPERMLENVQLHGGIVFSQQVLTALIVEAEWPRERAYRAVQALAARARDDEAPFRDLVATDPDVSGALSEATIAHCFEVETYLAHIDETYRRLGLSTSTTEAGPSAKPPEFAVEAGYRRREDAVMQVLSSADIGGLNLFRRGKVRDTFQLNDGTLLMIATDRLSAFDVVLPTPIPGKGTVLTQMSRWWFDQTAAIMPNHLLADVEEEIPEAVRADWLPRSMHVARAQRIDVECVVRGFISGSGWKEYRDKGTLAGETLQTGLQDSSRLPSPRFTPAIKKDDGHDVNISRQELSTLLGPKLADELESASLRLFDFATNRCQSVGIYLADTKFEFGFVNGTLTLIDEIFTPDSSRFWEMAEWKEGQPAVSFDKQFVRDYVEKLGWDKTDPGPALPEDVVKGTTERYVEAARRICGIDLTEMVAG